MENKPKRKIIRVKDFDYATARPYFITICAKDKKPYFLNKHLNNLIIKELLEQKKKTNINIFVYCLMPNHLHLLLAPGAKEISISTFIGAFKSLTSRIAWDFGVSGKLWQKRFYDRIVRKKEDLETIGQYILNNPVRQTLVSKWQDYEFLGLPDSW
ncbi:MAG: transposase [Candidatus Margulisbacteria bacterium]|nr:transposase [Candidatus Margulisiibacteriota bacterium]MBU1617780.1 transposase [Candidatus Margulisiibacteriota bacterium]